MSPQILAAVPLAAELKYDSPGAVPPIAFAVTALFAVAVILLGFDLVRRIRRSRYRAEIREELAAEIAERDAREADADGATVPADDDGDRRSGQG